MNIRRRKTKVIKIGNICIGGNNPIAVQSMAKLKTQEVVKTVSQIRGLEKAGCEIVRLAIKDEADAKAIRKIKRACKIPVVADIHFNWKFAIQAIDNGVDKIRLNPGNIYKKAQIKEVVTAAKQSHIPIRVGVNSGSLRGQEVSGGNMVKSALEYIRILEGFKFYDIVVSLKGSDIFDTIEANRKFSRLCDYPLHLGVTATGIAQVGIIKSSIALGSLLLEGIGDTIRVSLTDNPIQEVKVALGILSSLGVGQSAYDIISCPTCGRCEVDLVKIVKELESKLARWQVSALARSKVNRLVKVAVMGCVVNGPGEAKEADLGVAFGKKEGLFFKKGSLVRKVAFADCAEVLIKEMEGMQ